MSHRPTLALVTVVTLTLLGVGPLACGRPGGGEPTASHSTAPTPSAVAAAGPATPPCATPAVTRGHGIPDSTSGAALGYDEIDGYPLLVASTVVKSIADFGIVSWKWDGLGWVPLHPARCPAGSGSSLVSDPRLGMTVMVGGVENRLEAWGWDGQQWHWLPAVGDSPSGWGEQMAYDRAHDSLVFLLDEVRGTTATWTFDGTRWTRATTPTAPAIRQHAGLAYDPRTRTILLQGGTVSGGSDPVNDTWSWDGVTWTQLKPANAPGGGFSRLAYDAADGQMILLQDQFVCQPTCVDSVSTWSWDGGNWTRLHPTTQPQRWGNTSLTYDAVHRYLIVTTEAGQGAQGTETWVWPNGNWKRVV